MTREVLKEIVHRAVEDGSFRSLLQRDPAKALAGFNITADERSAIVTGDPKRLSSLGVDQRMSKAFGLGALNDASKAIEIDPGASAGGRAFIDEGSSAGSAVIVGDPVAPAGAEDLDALQAARALHLRMVEQDLDTSKAEAAATESGTVHSPMWRVEQDLDTSQAEAGTSGEKFLTEDEALQAYNAQRAADDAAGVTRSPMWRVEQDLDTSTAEAAATDAGTVHSPMWRIEQDLDSSSLEAAATTDTEGTTVSPMWRIEQDLDTGPAVEPDAPSGDTPDLTEY